MSKNSEDSNGAMALLVHHLEGESNKNLREDVQHQFLLESLGVAGANHRNGLLCEVKSSVFVCAEVKRKPMSEFLIG